jgi:hypothetical protein
MANYYIDTLEDQIYIQTMEEIEEMLNIIDTMKQVETDINKLTDKSNKIDNMLQKLKKRKYDRFLIRLETKNEINDNNITVDIIFEDERDLNALEIMLGTMKDTAEEDIQKTLKDFNQLLKK